MQLTRKILFAGIATLALAGCHRRQQAAVVPPAQVTTLPPVAVTLEPPVIVVAQPSAADAPAPPINITPAVPSFVTALVIADENFARGNYAGAALNFEEYLQLVASGGQRDRALFYLGLIYALPSTPVQDLGRSADYFERLGKEAPASSYTAASQVILSLRRQIAQLTSETVKRDERIKQLTAELERLVKIDSERRPTR